MSSELTRAIAEALRENGIWRCVDCGRVFAEYINGCPHHGEVETAPHVELHYPEAEDIAAALAPLIEARVREARAEAAADAYADIMRTAADASMACRRVAEDARNG